MKVVTGNLWKLIERVAPVLSSHAKAHSQLLKELSLLLTLLFSFLLIFLLPTNTNERTQVLEIFVKTVGGLVVFWGAYVAWKKHEVSLQNLRVAEEGQITERFTRAIEHLGSDKLEIRLGGIYALERIAKDSEKDYWPIMEVLTAYVREKSPWEESEDAANEEQWKEPSTDIQAILTVIGRRERHYAEDEKNTLNMMATDLRRADLNGANLKNAVFIGSNLMYTGFIGANLMSAELAGANLTGAHLADAILQNANLENANLERAYLNRANLEFSFLYEANLNKTCLNETILCGVDLYDTVGLTKKQIDSAIIDRQTRLPMYLNEDENSST